MCRGGAIAAALIWLAFYGWFLFGAGFPRPGLAAVPGIVSTAAIPLVLIGLLYIIAMRNSRTEMRRFGEAANLLRVERRRLERRLGRMRDQLTAARGEICEQAQLQEALGNSVPSRIDGVAAEVARVSEGGCGKTGGERGGAG